ncbi:MAG: ATP-dependent dethiobiotin synthetase BioD [Actinophytocola sp.]|nr:ATP-dependent dethiobiotin synthetase BioD [Actinophytocola sp.]
MSVLIVTGTDTEVGKTVVTAGIAAIAGEHGHRVAVIKPAQTGVRDGEPGDVDVVRRLAGDINTRELRRYPDPLAPDTAARRSGIEHVTPAEVAEAAADLNTSHDLVLVEGAGGLLVRLDAKGGSLADVAWSLAAPVVIVARAGLGTLNATALTAEVATRRGLNVAGVVVGAWPAEPGLAETCNLTDLPVAAGAPLLGVLDEGIGTLSPGAFVVAAERGLSPWFGGRFDPEQFAAGLPSCDRGMSL